jgi:hypothetical protein
MNPYATSTRSRIQPRDLANAVGTGAFKAATNLAILERTRASQAEAEVARLLKEHGVVPPSVASRIAMLRQAVGASLVRLGARLASASASGVVSCTWWAAMAGRTVQPRPRHSTRRSAR